MRAEAAFALGQVEGGGALVLRRLEVEADEGVRAALLEALGRQGGTAAIPVLVEAIDRRVPFLRPPLEARAASRAAGTLALRKVQGADGSAVADALLRAVRRADLELRRDAAWALSALRLADPEEARAGALVEVAASEPDPIARAWLVRAAGGVTGPARDALLARAARDPDPGVRIAACRAAGPAGWTGVADLLGDPDPGVRRMAIAAVGAVGALDRRALLAPIVARGATQEAAEAWLARGDTRLTEAAEALQALGSAGLVDDPAAWLDVAVPETVRATAAGLCTDNQLLARLALEDGDAPVRTAAALAMVEREPPPMMIRPLLDARDPVVVAVAAEALAGRPTASASEALLRLAETADHADVLRPVAQALVALFGGRRPLVAPPKERVRGILPRLLSSPDAGVRAAARALAEATRVEAAPDPIPADPREVSLAEVGRIRSARIATGRGEFVIDLLPEEAPIAVANFARLAEVGWYDGQRFHRVVPGFVVQTGDPRGDGMGGPAWTIPDELGPLHYDELVVGMALSGPDTGGSQWFATVSPQPHLDAAYTIFGRVTGGGHVVRHLQPGERIERVVIERGPGD